MKVSAARLAGAAALSLLLAPLPAPAAAPAGRYTASGGVVTDHKTGLNWQQTVLSMKYDVVDAMAYCSGNVAAALSGTGWRLPAIKELQTLVDYSVALPGPTIDSSAFPETPTATFWSSTPFSGPLASDAAWFVDFSSGSTGNNGNALMYYVRCVR